MNKPELIKFLCQEGMPQKLICLITRSNQSYVSKVCGNKIKTDVQVSPNFSDVEASRYMAVQMILSTPALPTTGITKDDIAYIHLLKYCLVDKGVVRDLYSHISENRFRILWTKKSVDFRDFNSTLIGIDLEVFDELFSGYTA